MSGSLRVRSQERLESHQTKHREMYKNGTSLLGRLLHLKDPCGKLSKVSEDKNNAHGPKERKVRTGSFLLAYWQDSVLLLTFQLETCRNPVKLCNRL